MTYCESSVAEAESPKTQTSGVYKKKELLKNDLIDWNRNLLEQEHQINGDLPLAIFSHTNPLSLNRDFLSEDPDNYDLYTYYNRLFLLEGDNAIDVTTYLHPSAGDRRIGFATRCIEQLIEDTSDKSRLSSELNALRQRHIEKLAMIGRRLFNTAKLLFPAEHAKRLYDISLSRVLTDEEAEILDLIGGSYSLQKAIMTHPDMYFSPAVFSLYKAGCLNSRNFQRLLPLGIDASCVAIIFEKMEQFSLLTQENIDFLFRHKGKGDTTLSIRLGILALAEYDLLNHQNQQFIIKNNKIAAEKLKKSLAEMDKAGDLELKEMCFWPGSQELEKLVSSLDHMFAHGLGLLASSHEEGKQAMMLALSLKQDIKSFYERPVDEKTYEAKHDFTLDFMKKLHSKDHLMKEDRALWQVVLANTLISFTGIGLFAVIGHLIVNRYPFFAQKKIDFMEKFDKNQIVSLIK
jgi:hypothetical protein